MTNQWSSEPTLIIDVLIVMTTIDPTLIIDVLIVMTNQWSNTHYRCVNSNDKPVNQHSL